MGANWTGKDDATVKKSLSKSGDARTAAEKAADRFAAAKLSERRFSLTGAWAGSDWICNCRGRLNHGNIALCPRCDLRRPGMRHWMAQSIRWGAVATADHHAAARAYLSTALFCAPFHGGLDAAGYDALLRQVAQDFNVPISVLSSRSDGVADNTVHQ